VRVRARVYACARVREGLRFAGLAAYFAFRGDLRRV